MLFIMTLAKSMGLLMVFASSAVPWGTMAEVMLFSLPDLAALLVPLLTFGTILWVYARLFDDLEIVVWSAAGVGPWRLARPALLFASVMLGVGWLLSLWLVPLSFGAFKDREHEIHRGLASALLESGRFNPIGTRLSVYFADGDPEGGMLGIIVHDTRVPEMQRTVVASSGRLLRQGDGLTFLMEDGYIQERERGMAVPRIVGFESFALIADADSLGMGARRGRGINERPIEELLFAEPRPEEAHLLPILRAHGHHQLAMPTLCLGLAGCALGLILCARPNRRGAPWWRWPAALSAGAGSQWLLIGATSLAERDSGLLPVIWIAVALPAIVGWWCLLRSPRRRRSALPRLAVALPAEGASQ